MLLIDIVKSYDDEKIKYLLGIWEKTILNLSTQIDPKKIFGFLKNTGIVNIDEHEKIVYVGIPNEFTMVQIKKFLGKKIKESIKNVYSEQFDTEFVIYEPFNNGGNLTADLKKLLNLKEDRKEKTIVQKNGNESSKIFGTSFDPMYTFSNFVAGSNNNFAFSVAKAVADNPGTAYNPLFLYGNVGLGKTHLMQAIGNEILAKDPEKVVVYLPTSKLIDEIVDSTKKNNLTGFLSKFNNIDVIMLDDVQFLAGKDKTQEIFHNIFNDFQMNKKQVILSGDRPPKELINIAPRLQTRFALGITVDIKAPDFETRIAILQSKLESKKDEIDYDLLEIIAKYTTNNVRELEGILNSLITRKKLLGCELTENDVYEQLKTAGYSPTESKINNNEIATGNTRSAQNFGNIVELVGQYYNLSTSEIKSESRKKEITTTRQILMLIAKKYFDRTYEKIGDYFGGKKHASVIYAVNNIEKRLKTDKNLAHDYNVFVERIEK